MENINAYAKILLGKDKGKIVFGELRKDGLFTVNGIDEYIPEEYVIQKLEIKND